MSGEAHDQDQPLILGRYRLGPEIGRGGMSTVHRGEDIQLGREVAIKLLAPHLSADPQFRRRLLAEARMAARLPHPHIVQVFDAGTTSTTHRGGATQGASAGTRRPGAGADATSSEENAAGSAESAGTAGTAGTAAGGAASASSGGTAAEKGSTGSPDSGGSAGPGGSRTGSGTAAAGSHTGGDGPVVLVLELVRGESVQQRLAGGPLPVEEAVEIAAQVAEALAFAHGRGLVHRDVKPGNILLDSRSGAAPRAGSGPGGGRAVRAKLADFGIARSLDTASSLTATGVVIGSPPYLAPEVLTGAPAGPQSDVYGLGVTLFEMLTARLPFEAATPAGALTMRLSGDPPPVTALRPDVPPWLDGLVARAVAREPAQRFPDAAAMAQALRDPHGAPTQVLATVGPAPKPGTGSDDPTTLWTPPTAAAAAGAAGAAALGARGAPAPPGTARAAPARPARRTPPQWWPAWLGRPAVLVPVLAAALVVLLGAAASWSAPDGAARPGASGTPPAPAAPSPTAVLIRPR